MLFITSRFGKRYSPKFEVYLFDQHATNPFQQDKGEHMVHTGTYSNNLHDQLIYLSLGFVLHVQGYPLLKHLDFHSIHVADAGAWCILLISYLKTNSGSCCYKYFYSTMSLFVDSIKARTSVRSVHATLK